MYPNGYCMSSSRLKAQNIELETKLKNSNSLKNKHCNGYYLYKLLWCVILMARKYKKLMTGDQIEFVSGNYMGLTGEVIATDYDSKDKRALYGYLHTVKLDNGKIGYVEKSEHWRFL